MACCSTNKAILQQPGPAPVTFALFEWLGFYYPVKVSGQIKMGFCKVGPPLIIHEAQFYTGKKAVIHEKVALKYLGSDFGICS